MMRLRRAAALVLSAAVLAACGGGGDASGSDAPSTGAADADPATGDVVEADDFTFDAPDGWQQEDGSAMPSINFLALARDPGDEDGFPDSVNVVSDPTLLQVDGVEEVGDAIEVALDGVATNVELQKPTTVDGEDAAVVTATFTQGGLTYDTIQYAVAHDDAGYVVSFGFSQDRPTDERTALAEAVMASWAWTD